MLEFLELPLVKALFLIIISIEVNLLLHFLLDGQGNYLTKIIFTLSLLAIYYQYRIWRIQECLKKYRSKGKTANETDEAVKKLMESKKFRYFSLKKKMDLKRIEKKSDYEESERTQAEDEDEIAKEIEEMEAHIFDE